MNTWKFFDLTKILYCVQLKMVRLSTRALHAERRKACKSRSRSKECLHLKKNKQGVLVSAKKSHQAKTGGLALWTKAAQAEGYLVKGNFRKLPAKGTAAYERIKARYNMLKRGGRVSHHSHRVKSRSKSRSRSRRHRSR